jgi:ABC-2 type transport system ATP-binding protein
MCTGPIEVDAIGTTMSAPIRTGDRVVPSTIRALDDAGVDVLDVEVRRPTLDDVFLNLTGRPAEAEESLVPETDGAAR